MFLVKSQGDIAYAKICRPNSKELQIIQQLHSKQIVPTVIKQIETSGADVIIYKAFRNDRIMSKDLLIVVDQLLKVKR